MSDLGPIIAAIIGPMLAFIAVSMRYQHQDSVKTRELISDVKEETRELIFGVKEETRELISGSSKETREWVTGEIGRLERVLNRFGLDLKELSRGLQDARERLARIEGHLGIGAVPPQGEADEQHGNTA